MGLIVLDAGVLIGFLESNDTHHERARDVLYAALEANDKLVMPASVLAEILVAPARQGDGAIRQAREFVAKVPIEVAPLDEEVAVAAAQLRASHSSLKLPDALVIATTRILGADQLVTTDRRWPTRKKLDLEAEMIIL